MPVLRIESLADPRLTPFRSLKSTNATRWQERFIAEGEKLTRRLLASGLSVHALLVSQSHLERLAGDLPPAIDVLVVPDEWVEQLVGFNFHRGVLACGQRPASVDLGELLRNSSGDVTLVACPDVQDPENLGAILRIGSAFGVSAVVLGRNCADPFSRRVLRVSMGAAFRVPIAVVEHLETELASIRQTHEVQLWAAVVDPSAMPWDQAPRPRRVALLLGSEGHGLAPHWLALCDRAVTIPMREGVDSLNVAVAAGILLYELSR